MTENNQQKLEIRHADPNLAFFMELQEINKHLASIHKLQANPTPIDLSSLPPVPPVVLSGVVNKLGEVLEAIQEKKAEEVEITLDLI